MLSGNKFGSEIALTGITIPRLDLPIYCMLDTFPAIFPLNILLKFCLYLPYKYINILLCTPLSPAITPAFNMILKILSTCHLSQYWTCHLIFRAFNILFSMSMNMPLISSFIIILNIPLKGTIFFSSYSPSWCAETESQKSVYMYVCMWFRCYLLILLQSFQCRGEIISDLCRSSP